MTKPLTQDQRVIADTSIDGVYQDGTFTPRISKRTGKPIKLCDKCGYPKQRCQCLELAMLQQIRFGGLPEPEREVRFHPERKWQFDFAWKDQMLAVECEGGTWTSGAHNRGQHFESDAEKYNEAALRGWRVLRFNNHQIKDGRALAVIERAMNGDQS